MPPKVRQARESRTACVHAQFGCCLYCMHARESTLVFGVARNMGNCMFMRGESERGRVARDGLVVYRTRHLVDVGFNILYLESFAGPHHRPQDKLGPNHCP